MRSKLLPGDSSSDEEEISRLGKGLSLVKGVLSSGGKKAADNIIAPDFGSLVVLDSDDPNRIITQNINLEPYKRKHLVAKLEELAKKAQEEYRAITSIVINNCNDPDGRILQSVARSSLVTSVIGIKISGCDIGRISTKAKGDALGNLLHFPKLLTLTIEDSTIGVFSLRAPRLKADKLKLQNSHIIGAIEIDTQLSYPEVLKIKDNRSTFVNDYLKECERYFNRKLENIKTEILDERLALATYQPKLQEIIALFSNNEFRDSEGLLENLTRISSNLQIVRSFFSRKASSSTDETDCDVVMNFVEPLEKFFKIAFGLAEGVLLSVKGDPKKSLTSDQQEIMDIVKQILVIPDKLSKIKIEDKKEIAAKLSILNEVERYEDLGRLKADKEGFKKILEQLIGENALYSLPISSPKNSPRDNEAIAIYGQQQEKKQ